MCSSVVGRIDSAPNQRIASTSSRRKNVYFSWFWRVWASKTFESESGFQFNVQSQRRPQKYFLRMGVVWPIWRAVVSGLKHLRGALTPLLRVSFWSCGEWNFLISVFLFCIFYFFFYVSSLTLEVSHDPVSLEEGALTKAAHFTLSLWKGRRSGKRNRYSRTAGSWLFWIEYGTRNSMNTWIISSFITHKASDLYSEHSKVYSTGPTL